MSKARNTNDVAAKIHTIEIKAIKKKKKGGKNRKLKPAKTQMEKRMEKYNFVKFEGPYDPCKEFVPIELPPSVYSAFVTLTLSASNAKFKGSRLFTMIIPTALCVLVCYIIQFAFIFYISEIVVEVKEEHKMCNAGNIFLRMICLFVFVGATLMDMMETFTMHIWANQIPTWQPTLEDPVIKECRENSGDTNLPLQKFVQPDNEKNVYGDNELIKPAVGISMQYRVGWIYFLVLMPKALIALYLLYIGSGHVLASQDRETIILNTVAAIFVFEVDDIFYNLMVSPLYRVYVEEIGKFTMSKDEVPQYFHVLSYVMTVLFLVFGLGTYRMWCF